MHVTAGRQRNRPRVVEMNAVLAFGRGPITTLKKHCAHISRDRPHFVTVL
jgi:hypothetical protein